MHLRAILHVGDVHLSLTCKWAGTMRAWVAGSIGPYGQVPMVPTELFVFHPNTLVQRAQDHAEGTGQEAPACLDTHIAWVVHMSAMHCLPPQATMCIMPASHRRQ